MARHLTETNIEMLARTIGTLEVATWGAVSVADAGSPQPAAPLLFSGLAG